MRATVLGFLVLGLLVLASVVQAFAYYPLLPEKVASEFDFAGVPSGWQSKGAFFLAHLGLVLGMAFGLVPLLCALVRFGPAWSFDMPHKKYWLAEPRGRQTRSTLVAYTLWILDLTLAFVAVLMELVYRANLTEAPCIGRGLWISLAVFGLAVAVCLVAFYRRFGRVPHSSGEQQHGPH